MSPKLKCTPDNIFIFPFLGNIGNQARFQFPKNGKMKILSGVHFNFGDTEAYVITALHRFQSDL